MIIMNETDYAMRLIQERTLTNKPSEALRVVAKYYIWTEKLRRKDVKKKVISFLSQSSPMASIPKWDDAIEYAISVAAKHKPIEVDEVVVTVPEMEVVDAIKSKQERKLAFTLLCLSKYWDSVNGTDNHWVNSKDTEIMKLANISPTLRRQSSLYASMRDAGLIEFSKRVDNTNVRVVFQKEGDAAVRVTDFRNLGYQYAAYHGEPYFACESCGITTNGGTKGKRGGQRKYCPECANKIYIQKTVDLITRKRKSEQDSENVRNE